MDSPMPGCSTAEVFAISESPRARYLPSLLCSDINALAHKKCQQMPSSVKRQVVSVRQRRDFLQKDGTCWVLWAAHANPSPCDTSLLVRQPWCPCEPARCHSQPSESSGRQGLHKTQVFHGSFARMFPAAAVCPTALSGTRWDGSRGPSWVPVTALCVGKGAASSGDTKRWCGQSSWSLWFGILQLQGLCWVRDTMRALNTKSKFTALPQPFHSCLQARGFLYYLLPRPYFASYF